MYAHAPYHRRAFHRPGTAYGAAFCQPHTPGEWIYLGGLLAPLAAGMLIKDPEKRWPAIRAISVLESAAFLGTKLWAYRTAANHQAQARER
jgi:hypothetical protein